MPCCLTGCAFLVITNTDFQTKQAGPPQVIDYLTQFEYKIYKDIEIPITYSFVNNKKITSLNKIL